MTEIIQSEKQDSDMFWYITETKKDYKEGKISLDEYEKLLSNIGIPNEIFKRGYI
jgi:hypothetical protein